MKNIIPLIIAVVLGLAAVFAVMRLIKPSNENDDKQYIDVVAAAKGVVPADGEIKVSWLMRRRVDAASAPSKAIPWSQSNQVIGQKAIRSLAKGDYILTTDISGMKVRLSNAVAEGEWAVPVTFADPALVKFLQPGDEIAIMGSFTVKEEVKKVDRSEKPDIVEHQATSVIFPCVKILDIGKGDAVRRDESGVGAGTIIVSLTPQQATALVAAQREMELYPALRRPNDTGVMRRRDVGVVNEATFKDLKEGLATIKLPDVGKGGK